MIELLTIMTQMNFKLKCRLFALHILLLSSLILLPLRAQVGAQRLDKHTAQQLIDNLQHASENEAYSGTLTVQDFFGKSETSQWKIDVWPTHRAVYQLFDEKADSVVLVLVRDQEKLYFKPSGRKQNRLIRRYIHSWFRQMHLFSDPDLLTQNYQFDLSDGEEHRGRITKFLQVSPLYDGRSDLSIRFDAENYFLYSLTRKFASDSTGIGTYKRQWQDLNFAVPDTAIFQEAIAGTELWDEKRPEPQNFTNLTQFLAHSKADFLLPQYAPTGFKLQFIRQLEHRNINILHFLYSDGLSTISLFQDKEGHKPRKRRPPELEIINVIAGEKDKIHYRLISEITTAELEHMENQLFSVKRESGFSLWLWGTGLGVFVGINFIFWFVLIWRKKH
ncbi:MAG: hypothetical protein H6696_02750 [Deferribacteres bacterium]|nr:hypothetical protein [Deferribacteres bacterium]